jgi:thiamine kinase-like enzyme
VAALRLADENLALVKLYTRKAYNRARHNANAFHSRGPLRVARLLARLDSRRLLAFEWLPGRLLKEIVVASQMDCEAVSATGAALAGLHAQDVEGLNCWTCNAAAADLVDISSEVGFIRPDLARRTDELARRLAAGLAGVPSKLCPVHGDFSANQVLVDRPPEVSIIDLDWAGYGDPADDLGTRHAGAGGAA